MRTYPAFCKITGNDSDAVKLRGLIRNGLVGTITRIVDWREANYIQKFAENSRLKIPVFLAQDAIHGHCRIEGTTVFPTPIGMASTWNPDLVRKAAVITARMPLPPVARWPSSCSAPSKVRATLPLRVRPLLLLMSRAHTCLPIGLKRFTLAVSPPAAVAGIIARMQQSRVARWQCSS